MQSTSRNGEEVWLYENKAWLYCKHMRTSLYLEMAHSIGHTMGYAVACGTKLTGTESTVNNQTIGPELQLVTMGRSGWGIQ